MATPLLWQLLLAVFALNILVSPALTTGTLSSDHGIDGLGAYYTRTIWEASDAPPPTTWSSALSSSGTLTSTGLSSIGNGTQLLSGVTTWTSIITIVGTSFAALPSSGVQTSLISTFSPLVPLTPTGDLSSVSLTTASPSTPNVPVNTPWPSTTGFLSSSTFDYSTWLASLTSSRSGSSFIPGTSSTSGDASSSTLHPSGASSFESVVTTTGTVNGTPVITSAVITFFPPLTSSDASPTTSSESSIASTTTVNSSVVVTFPPPLTTGTSSSSAGLSSSDVALTTIVNGTTFVGAIPALTTDALSSTSGFPSTNVLSTAVVNGSTTVVVIPPFTTGSSSSTSGFFSADVSSTAIINGSTTVIVIPTLTSAENSESATSSTAGQSASSTSSFSMVSSTASLQTSSPGAMTSSSPATYLPTPTAPVPASTNSNTVAGSMVSSLSSSISTSTSSTVAPIVITPIPIILSSGEQSSTKDPKKTKGSHSDSVSEDKHGNKHTIHFPVLPGGCWFCPPGPPGFRLPELTLPGIYPPGKPPGPGWMSLPALTIDVDGNPKFEPEPLDPDSTPASASATATSDSESATPSQSTSSSSDLSISSSDSIESSASSSESTSSSQLTGSSQLTSSPASTSSCATTTTQICSTLTSFGVDASGSTTTTRVASTCSPTIGCSVLASNTATATTASASSGCWEYNFKLDDQEFESEDEQSFQESNPEAAASGFGHVGGCTFTRQEYDPAHGSSTTIPITIHIASWPDATFLASSSDATEWFAATMASETEGACPTLTYKKFDNVASLTASPIMTGVGGIPATYSLDGHKPSVSVDHAYDIPLVLEFLESIMAAQSDLTSFCDSFNAFFIASDPAYDNLPRLQRLFNDAANAYSNDYAVDSVLNDIKAKLLANLDGLRGGQDGTKQVGSTNVTMSDSEKLQVLNEIAAAVALINDDGVTSRFNITNIAYRAGFMAIDQLGENPGCSAATLPAPSSGALGWADAYTNFMNSKLAQQNTAISEHIESIVATQGGWFTQTADQEGNLNLAGRGLEAFKTGYPSSMWTMNTASMLSWDIQPFFYPLSPATCYTTPSLDIPGLLSLYSSLTAAETTEMSITDLPLTSSLVNLFSAHWQLDGEWYSFFVSVHVHPIVPERKFSWNSSDPLTCAYSRLVSGSLDVFSQFLHAGDDERCQLDVFDGFLDQCPSNATMESSSSEAASISSTSSEPPFFPTDSATPTTSSSSSSEAASTTTDEPAATTSAEVVNCNSFDQGMPEWNFDLDGANRAIDWACSFWAYSTDHRDQDFSKQWGEAYESPIEVRVQYWGDGNTTTEGDDVERLCWYDEDRARSSGEYSQLCKENLQFVLNQCDTSSNDYFWWKTGGSKYNACWIWSLARGTFEGLPDGYSHNDAEAADDVVPGDDNYRTDSTCDKWEDCPECPVEHAQRKCDDHKFGIKYCTCKDPEPEPVSNTAAPAATAVPDNTGYTKLSCTNGEQGNPTESFDLDTAKSAIDYICKSWSGAIEMADYESYFPLDYGSALENPLHFHIAKNDDGGSCPDLSKNHGLALRTCQDGFSYLLNSCDTSSNDKYWWKSGGTFIEDCYEWALLRGEFDTRLKDGYSRNDAQNADDLTSDDYRPDSSCYIWQHCPKCPGDGLQRKCVTDDKRPDSGACLCYDPSSGSAAVDAASTSLNVSSAPLQARSNVSDVKSLAPVVIASVNSSAVKVPSNVLQCNNAAQGSPRLNFELSGATAAIEYACNKWAHSDILKFLPFHVDWSAPYEDPIELEMLYLGDRERSVARHLQGRRDTPFCANFPRSPDEFKDRCIANMQYIVNSCDTASNGHYWWKSGGARTNECWRWSISRGLFATLPVGYLHNDAIGADDYTGVPEYQDYRPDSSCHAWQQCPKCSLNGAQRKCRGDESEGPRYCVCKP
ncbi:hypothetical protein IWZ03DRAFT_431617 [Phyllosticta citriasiana]|uniref:Uncharacterized protein n=1 Tax=Phyllosticta citriasiana TaxID=595635 RepID=A0ABR1KHR8_9PEZI